MLPDFPGWCCRVTFSYSGAPVGFDVIAPAMEPASERAGVTARLLRRLPLGEIQQKARDALVRDEEFSNEVFSWIDPNPQPHWGEAFADRPRPGRAGREDRDYAKVCALYVERLHCGSKTPVKDLAGPPLHLSETTVRNILHAARSRGLLTKPPRGVAGGELTDKAIRLLQEGEDV